jgi:2'-5' RNA ligase
MDAVLRTFVAIALDAALLEAIDQVQGRYKRQVPPGSVKWVAPDGIHLTLKFLGETPVSRVRAVEAALRSACVGHAPFEFSVGGRGCFPNLRRPRVVWLGIQDRGRQLARLQESIEREIGPLGFPTEERGFSPHLTLGRIARSAGPSEEVAVGQAVEMSVVDQLGMQRVNEVCLISSDLRPTGAVYHVLAMAPLAGPAPD